MSVTEVGTKGCRGRGEVVVLSSDVSYIDLMGRDFSVEVIEESGATVAHVRGDVDMATCERLRDAIEPYLGPRQNVILDLAEVAFMDSSMLNLLVQARGRLTQDGGSLVLRNPSDAARRLLTIGEMSDLLEAEGERSAEEN
jgi:anti-anti-sigma factor